MGNKLDVKGKARRLMKRDDLRQRETSRVSEQRSWLEDRARKAAERKDERTEERRLAREMKAEESDGSRASYEVQESPTAVSVVSDRTVSGNYKDRRAQGARGKQRPLRRREMPGAIERRIERNRKAW